MLTDSHSTSVSEPDSQGSTKGGGDFDTLGQELLIAISSTFFDRMTRFLAWWLIFSRSTPIFSKIEDWRSLDDVSDLN